MLREDSANSMPYGALPYLQIHYIVSCPSSADKFLAKCNPIAKGFLSSRRVIAVKWTGMESFAATLENDGVLTDMLKEAFLHEGELRIEPVENDVRIYFGWKQVYETHFSRLSAEIADRIAMHIKNAMKRT